MKVGDIRIVGNSEDILDLKKEVVIGFKRLSDVEYQTIVNIYKIIPGFQKVTRMPLFVYN